MTMQLTAAHRNAFRTGMRDANIKKYAAAKIPGDITNNPDS
jgi:hypothetical protein